MKNEQNVPQVRFKGFTDAWEQREVLDLLIQPITDGPHETPELVEDGIPFISVDAIVDNKIDFNRKRGNITESYNLECCKKYKPQLLDVFLVKSGSTVGKVAIVETTDNFNIWSPLAAMRCGDKTNPYFLYFLLQTRDMQAQVADKASNGTQPNLSMRELEKFGTTVPSSIDEQKVIGNYFKSLDHLITLHQRKCETLQKLKKSMLQKMFPKNGSLYPEIRFAGFTDAWEQRELGDICEYHSSSLTAKDVYEDGSYDLYDANSLIGKTNKGCMEKDYITIIKDGAGVGRTRLLPKNSMFLGTMGALTPRNSDLDFLYQLITKADLGKTYTGSTIPHIYFKDYGKNIYCIPSCTEQQQIGSYFRNLDNLITLHQRKLETLKKMKKSMLQKMFI